MLNNWKKYIPNIITTIRLILAVCVPFIFLNDNKNLAIIIFIIAALSDALDGYLARKWHVISLYGKMIDPFADKTLSMGVLILLAMTTNHIFYILLILEGFIMLIGALSFQSEKKVNVKKIGKIKTSVLFPTVAAGLLSTIMPIFNIILIPLIVLTLVLQCLAIKEYAKKFIK
jgi:CDP-diacylglycerol--glycerol-3-phosphate 3-phosphatidyltransferase